MNHKADSTLYIGLISGTSMDAVDCALVDFQNGTPNLIDFINLEIPAKLKSSILGLCGDGQNQVQTLGSVDVELGQLFAQASLDILHNNQLSSKQITAIGSHGQTVRHQPPQPDSSILPFTLQLGDPNTIAARTGITTIADFRRKDMAIGGQGAPLVPAFHREIFSSNEHDRFILNIGGISNLTLLIKNDKSVSGFDTGPGNVLLDAWIQKNKNLAFDKNGDWGASGKVNSALLSKLLDDNYFQQSPPKSTGREYFNLHWLESRLLEFNNLPTEDIQATLVEFTTTSICDSILPLLSSGELIVCGGGARNGEIISSLKAKLSNYIVTTSTEQGLDGDSVEAIAFAWLAKQAMERKTIDYTEITGASYPIIMGGVYYSE